MIRADTFTNGARRALRRVESLAPEAAESIGEELARVRRRIAAGDFHRAAAAAGTAATLADRLEHTAAALPGWRAVRSLAAELAELAAVLRLEARAEAPR